MLNDREKLIELILEADEVCSQTDCLECKYQYKRTEDTCGDAMLADHLIANGVTVQKRGEWIDHASSCCGKVNPTLDMNGWGDYVSENTNYCGNCGADMRGAHETD